MIASSVAGKQGSNAGHSAPGNAMTSSWRVQRHISARGISIHGK